MNTNNTTPHELARIRVQSWHEGIIEHLEMRFKKQPSKLEHLARLAGLKARMRFQVLDFNECQIKRHRQDFLCHVIDAFNSNI